MRISVALCTYNGANFLNEQLESIKAQTILPHELVVCDDGSSDETIGILERFANSTSFKVRIFQNKQNLGSTKNFEQAIRLCQCEFIALADQDDIWRIDKLSSLSTVLKADATLGGVFSNGELIDHQSHRLGAGLWDRVNYSRPRHDRLHIEKELIEVLLKRDVVTGATMMFRADLRDELLPVNGSWVHDGWISWMLVLYSGMAAVAEPLISYRVHANQQIGLSPVSFREKIRRARQLNRTHCLQSAKRFEDLRDYWIRNPGRDFNKRLNDMEERIKHLYHQANLPTNRLMRVYHVCRAIPAYRKYANGVSSICRDLFV